MSEQEQFYYKNNRFQQLRGFYFTAILGSVSKASRVINLTQPAVSLQIKALESDLNTSLFERKGPNISLTKDGTTLLELVSPLVEGIDNLKENFKVLTNKTDEKKITIAANQATILYLLPKLIKKYTTIYPDMKVRIQAAIAEDGIEKLRRGDVDIIVGPPSFDIPKDFIYYPIFYYDPVLITRPEHPLAGKENVTIEEMSKYQLILPPSHLRTIKTMDQIFAQHNFQQSETRLQFDGWEIIKKYVEMDMAITIALSIAIEEDPVLVGTKLNHYFPRSSYGIILHRGQILTQKVQDFIKLIQPDFVQNNTFTSYSNNNL